MMVRKHKILLALVILITVQIPSIGLTDTQPRTFKEKYEFLQMEYLVTNRKYLEGRLEIERLKKELSESQERIKELESELKYNEKDLEGIEIELTDTLDKYETLIEKIEGQKEDSSLEVFP